MSRYYHIPLPDYDRTIRQTNPYIPTPDYTTFKYNKAKNRPSLNNIGLEFIKRSEPEYQEFEEVRHHPVSSERRRNEFVQPKRFKSRFPNVNENMLEIKTHSYIEDRETEESNHHRTTKEHIKQIGVPVLPGIVKPNISSYELAAPVASDQNKAYLRHLENHQKFDTIHGDRGIENCEICEIMRKQVEAEQTKNVNESSWNEHYSGNYHHHHQISSDIGAKRRKTDVRDIFAKSEVLQPEPEPSFDSIKTRARQNYERKRNEELSVNIMEPVDILQNEQGYVLCRKENNQIGWIPKFVFES